MTFFCIVILAISAVSALKFNRYIERTIFPSACCYILSLYMLGLCNMLKYAKYFTYGLIIFAILYGVYCLKNDYKHVLRLCCRIVLIYVIFAFLMTYFCTAKQFLHTWDEFGHWGIYVKNIYYYQSLGTKNFTSTFGYPPFLGLIQYIVESFSQSFNEPALFKSIIFFSSLSICGVFKQELIMSRKWLLPCLMSIYFLPTTFFNNYFSTIYVDAVMGVIAGVTIYQFVNNDFSSFDFCVLCIYMSSLVLVKEFCVIYIMMLFVAFIIDTLFIRKELYAGLYKRVCKSIMSTVLFIVGLISPILSFLSWRLYLKATGYGSSAFGAAISMIASDNSDMSEFINLVINKYNTYLYNYGFSSGFKRQLPAIGYFSLIIMLLIIVCILISRYKKHDKLIVLFFSSIFVFVGYVTMLLYSYCYLFSKEEAMMLASFDRYIGTLLISIYLPFVLIILDTLAKLEIKKNWYIILPVLLLVYSGFDIPQIKESLNSYNNPNYESKVFFDTIYAQVSIIDQKTNKKDKVYFLMENNTADDLIYYFISRYEVTPIHLQQNYSDYSLTSSLEDNKKTMNKILNDFDYIYCWNYSDDFIKNYAEYFEDTLTVSRFRLFKVINGKLRLVI